MSRDRFFLIPRYENKRMGLLLCISRTGVIAVSFWEQKCGKKSAGNYYK